MNFVPRLKSFRIAFFCFVESGPQRDASHTHTSVSRLSIRNLLANPFNCDCRLSWFGAWLRSRRIVTGNPRCQSPAFLREIPLQDVAVPDFRCEDGRPRF